MEITMLKIVKTLSKTQLSRFFIQKLEYFDEKTGERRIEKILKRYVGEETEFDDICKLYYPIAKMTIRYGSRRFDVPEEKMKNFFSDPIKRRGLGNVIISIAKYGITKPQRLAAPFLVVWDITKACNLDCKHCYSSSGVRSSNELDTYRVKEIIDDMNRMGVVAIAFSGGEPLMRKDFFEITSYATSKNMYVAMASNGTLIDRRMAVKIRKAGIRYVEISIDGIDPRTHDDFRGKEGAFDRAIEGMRNCVREGIMTAMATTATKDNLKDIEKIIDMGKEIGIKRFIHFNFIPTGRGRFSCLGDLSPKEREDLLNMLYSKSKDAGIEILSTAPQYARVAVQKILGNEGSEISFSFYGGHMKGRTLELAEFISGCGAGRLYCAISSSGKVKPCVFMPIVVGELKERGFKDIWETSPVFNSLQSKENLKGHCGECQYKYVCGGCRSRAYAYYGDIRESDPGCIYNSDLYQEMVSNDGGNVNMEGEVKEGDLEYIDQLRADMGEDKHISD